MYFLVYYLYHFLLIIAHHSFCLSQTNPHYSQEKNRCEYLHNKLAHIKRLIAEYDQQQLQSWH